jgi:hypothetical protein
LVYNKLRFSANHLQLELYPKFGWLVLYVAKAYAKKILYWDYHNPNPYNILDIEENYMDYNRNITSHISHITIIIHGNPCGIPRAPTGHRLFQSLPGRADP